MKYLIGFEYEGVIIKDGKIITVPELVKDPRSAIYFSNMFDSFDALAEARSWAPNLFEVTKVGKYADKKEEFIGTSIGLLRSMCLSVEEHYAYYGASIYWGELAIPNAIHKDIQKRVKFGEKCVYNAIKDYYAITKDKNLGNDAYRGGGLHINISLADKSMTEAEAKHIAKILATYMPMDNRMLSKYREQGLWIYKRFPNGKSGVEYRSTSLALSDIYYEEYDRTKSCIHTQAHFYKNIIIQGTELFGRLYDCLNLFSMELK